MLRLGKLSETKMLGEFGLFVHFYVIHL
jgi:hypothetical protein